MNTFTWIPFFKEIAEAIHNINTKEDRGQQLVSTLNDVGIQVSLEDIGNGEKIPLQEIDPFSFLAMFLKYETFQRIIYFKKLKEVWSLYEAVPSDFNGVPDSDFTLFFDIQSPSKSEYIKALWSFFVKSYRGEKLGVILIEGLLDINNVHFARLTQALFLYNPTHYLPVDGHTIPFLEKQNITVDLKNLPEDYYALMTKVAKESSETYYQISYKARLDSLKNKQMKINLYGKKLYKASMGTFLKSPEYRHINPVEDFEGRGYLIIHRHTAHGQGSDFENTLNIGDYVYVTYSQPRLGGFYKVVSEVVTLPKELQDKLEDKNFIARKIELIKPPIIEHTRSLKEKKGWLPSGFTTFKEVKNLEEANNKLFNKFYGIELIREEDESDYEIVEKRPSYYYMSFVREEGQTMKTDVFIGNGTWENSSDDNKYIDEVNSIEVGDKLVLGDVFVDDDQVERHTIYRTGIVTENPKNGKLLKVDWDTTSPYQIQGNAKYNGLISKIHNVDNIDILFGEENKFGKKLHIDVNELSLNTILYGPPGTGKTYKLQNEYFKIFTDVIDRDIKRYKFVSFHQSFSYEDFIEGIKPVMSTEDAPQTEIAYEIQKGAFKQLCDLAEKDPNNPYALFIDEINRGNISNIFGELITLIEKDKRKGEPNALSLDLAYSKKSFSVPNNVYIIGTMNTADRSIEALDNALRRRFAFVEIMPNYDILKTVDTINIAELLKNINERITVLLDREHQIGHSYFVKVITVENLMEVFNKKVIPLLQEYFYNDYDKIGMVLGNKFIERKNEEVRFALDYNPDTEIFSKMQYELVYHYIPENFITALKESGLVIIPEA